MVTLPPPPSTTPDGADAEVDAEVDADPATFYVSPTLGDESSDGQTARTPWRDLQASLDRLGPGQTLFLLDGTYAGEPVEPPAMFVVRRSGEPDDWITVAAAPGHAPLIQPSTGNGFVVKGNYVEVRGLTVRGDGFGPDNPYGWGLLVRNSHHVRLVANLVSDMPVGGITTVESSHVDVLWNTVHDNSFWGTEQGSGISFWHSRDWGFPPHEDGYDNRIIGNIAYRNENKVVSRWFPGENRITDGNGIIIDESDTFSYSGRTLIANNVIFDNGGRGVLVTKAGNTDIVHNTLYHNGRTEELVSPPTEIGVAYSDDVRVFNNLTISRPGVPEFHLLEIGDVESAGNVFVTDDPSGFATSLDHVTTDAPELIAPSVDPALADFRLAPGSPVVGGGFDGLIALDIDFDGVDRDPGRVDAGAFALSPGG